MLPDHAAAAERVARLLARRATKAGDDVDSIVRGYIDDLTRDFQDVLDGSLLASEGARRHRSYVKRDAEPVYIAGMQAGGLEGDPELTAADNAAIRAWIDNQLGYVGDLWKTIEKLVSDYDNGAIERADYTAQRRGMYERLGVWGDALRDLAGQGKAAEAADQMVTWNLGETEQHCRICAKLDGKRHRLSWFTERGYIPQEKGSDTLECGGWRCDCTLTNDDDEVVLPA